MAKKTTRRRDLRGTRALMRLVYATPLVVGLVMEVQKYRSGAATLRYVVIDYAFCVITFAFIFRCMLRAHRYSLRRRHSFVRTAATGLATAVAAITVTALLRHMLHAIFPELIPLDVDEASGPIGLFFVTVANALLFMIVWSGVFLLPQTFRRAERQRTKIALARRETEILRLRAHLEPHFVLNTLNTIAGLVIDDPVEARRLIGMLGDLFRDARGERLEDAHSLADEIAWLERYAAIHESRHGRMVRFAWDVAPAAKTARVPRLVLQPLVENAVLHGVLRRRQGGTVKVRARVVGLHLVCEVEDDGPGFAPGPQRAGARGLQIVERALALLDGDASLTIASEQGTTCVTARLPVVLAQS